MVPKAYRNRLHRLQGQLHKLQQEIEAGGDCAIIIPQFLAVKGALTSALDEYLKLSLEACKTDDKQKIKQLITLVVKR